MDGVGVGLECVDVFVYADEFLGGWSVGEDGCLDWRDSTYVYED